MISSDSAVAIHVPEYFPRLEFFALVAWVDVFIVADTFQYSRQSHQNRAAIRTPHGKHWMSIPVRGGQHGGSIRDVRIADVGIDWRRKHWKSLEFNYRSTPYFEFFEADLSRVFAVQSNFLVDYSLASIHCILELLQLRTKVVYASSIEGTPSTAVDLIRTAGIRHLRALPETPAEWTREVADTSVLLPATETYRQNFDGFEPGLSSLDALMNLGPPGIRRIIQESCARMGD